MVHVHAIHLMPVSPMFMPHISYGDDPTLMFTHISYGLAVFLGGLGALILIYCGYSLLTSRIDIGSPLLVMLAGTGAGFLSASLPLGVLAEISYKVEGK